jgi:excisionase family DNA binding protein
MIPTTVISKRSRKSRPPLSRLAYSISEWADITNVSRPTIYRQMDSGALRFVQIRGVRRIPATELTWLKLIAD